MNVRHSRRRHSGASALEQGKMLLQSLYRGPPFGSRWLADRILVTKEANLVDCLLERDCLEPSDRDEILRAIWIGDELAVVIALLQRL